jgi:hypothetical protein
MYRFGQPLLAPRLRGGKLGFAATFMTETFAAKAFTEEASQPALVKAIAAKRSKDGVFSVEKSRDRCDMRNVRARQNRGLFATFFSMTSRVRDSSMPANFRGEFPSTCSTENLNQRQLG